jgi:hypothetical protein
MSAARSMGALGVNRVGRSRGTAATRSGRELLRESRRGPDGNLGGPDFGFEVGLPEEEADAGDLGGRGGPPALAMYFDE